MVSPSLTWHSISIVRHFSPLTKCKDSPVALPEPACETIIALSQEYVSLVAGMSAWLVSHGRGYVSLVAGTSAAWSGRQFAQFNIQNDMPRFITLRSDAIPSPATAWDHSVSSSRGQETCREREIFGPSSGDCCVSSSMCGARGGRGHSQGIWHHRGRAQGEC